jgi:hypothetical protein
MSYTKSIRNRQNIMNLINLAIALISLPYRIMASNWYITMSIFMAYGAWTAASSIL